MDNTSNTELLNLDIDLGTFIHNEFGEKYLFTLHQNTFKSIASSVLYKQTYSKELNKEDTLYIIIGTDSGLLLNYLHHNPPEKGSTYLFIDFPEIITSCCQTADDETNKRIHIANYNNWKSIAEEHSLSNYLFINKVTIVESFAVKDGYVSHYKLLAKKIDQELSDLKWQSLLSTGNQIFLQTQIKNLSENIYPASRLEKILQGKKAILLAGGPSLDLYLDWVEKHQKKFIIFAVSRIAKRLISTNIKPDFFVSIDPNDVSFDVSKELLFFAKDSILINQYHITPLILSQWQGLNFYLGPLYPWQTKDQPTYLNSVGPTVTNATINVALFMGIKEIILVGVDLCYSPQGYSHASGSIEHSIGPLSSPIGQLVTTNMGETAETENSFFNAINSLSSQAKAALEKNCQLINPSPNAAKIDNIKFIPIEKINTKEISQAYQSKSKIIKSLQPKDPIQDKLDHINKVASNLEQIRIVINDIIKTTKTALKYNTLFFQDDHPENHFKYKNKMDLLEEQLNNSPNMMGAICKSYGIREFLSFIKPAHDSDMSNDELKLWGETYYKAYKTGAKDLITLIKSTLLQLSFRLQELTKIKDINKICDFWEKNRSPGRALIYKQINDLTYQELSAKDKQSINRLITKYEDIIKGSSKDSFQFKRITNLANLNGTEFKAIGMYSRQDISGLKRLVKSLSEQKTEKAIPFLSFTTGLLLQLEGNIDEAINQYSKTDSGPALEQALKQILIIVLDQMQFPLAESVLQLLKQISPIHLPQLAKLYKIQKRYKDAVDTYSDYLEKFPEDIIQLINLAELYQITDNDEASQYIYQYILTLDADNIVANSFLNQTGSHEYH